jgi:DNA-binding NarL/FixJ family response regulator
MAYGVANDKRYKGGNYSGAIAAIEKIAKGLSSHPDVQNVLKRTNENLDEGKMSQIDQMQKDGKSAAEIAKLMKLDVKTVKSILGEEVCPKCDGEGCEHCNNTRLP